MTTEKMSESPAQPASTGKGRHVPNAGTAAAFEIEKARSEMLRDAKPRDRVRIGADALCEALVHQGVDVLFGYPGGVILPLYDVWADYPELRTILVDHGLAS